MSTYSSERYAFDTVLLQISKFGKSRLGAHKATRLQKAIELSCWTLPIELVYWEILSHSRTRKYVYHMILAPGIEMGTSLSKSGEDVRTWCRCLIISPRRIYNKLKSCTSTSSKLRNTTDSRPIHIALSMKFATQMVLALACILGLIGLAEGWILSFGSCVY